MKIEDVKLPRGERAVLTYHIGGEVQYVMLPIYLTQLGIGGII